MSKVKTQLVIEGQNKSRRAFKEVDTQLDSMNKKLAVAGKALVAAFSTSMLTGAVRSIANTADAYNLMNARLRLATESQEEFNYAQAELQRIAISNQAPVESLITLYTRISRPLKEAGRSQQEILKVIEAVSTSFRVSGASAAEAENGVIQFAQALGAGALRGDEFNSVAEQAPRLMQALADGLGVPTGALKDMAAAGELTADVVTDALIGQLEALRLEAESLPETVGGAMTALLDQWNKAIAEADMQPLIDSLDELRERVSDPIIAEGIGRIASALVRLGGLAVGAAADFGDLGDTLAIWAAKLTGNLSELDRIEKEISAIKKSISGSWSPGDLLVNILYTDEELKEKLALLEQARKDIIEQITGISDETQAAADAAELARAEDLTNYRAYIRELKTLQVEQVKAVKAALKEQLKAEKEALSEVEGIRNKRLQIEDRYNRALASLGQGGKEPTFTQASDLKVKAMQALANKDVAAAQAYAQQALAVLQELDRAGANTYGFEGFITELRNIELAANDLEQTSADQKLAEIQTNIGALKEQADDLENLPITFQMDEAELENVRAKIQALAKQLGQELVLPVTVAHPDGVDVTAIEKRLNSPPGFAGGGHIRGPGTSTSDSILARLSNGEYVIKAAAVRKYGTQLLDQLNGMRLPKFADGGLVADVAPASSGTPVHLHMDGQSYEVRATQDVVDALHRAVRVKKLRNR